MEVMDELYGYLTTRGWRTGRPHEIEIWFAIHDGRFWLISGAGESADWIRNLRTDPHVWWRVGPRTFEATAVVVDEQAASATPRRLLAAKYQGWQEGEPLSDWAAEGLPVAIRVSTPSGADPRRGGGAADGEW